MAEQSVIEQIINLNIHSDDFPDKYFKLSSIEIESENIDDLYDLFRLYYAECNPKLKFIYVLRKICTFKLRDKLIEYCLDQANVYLCVLILYDYTEFIINKNIIVELLADSNVWKYGTRCEYTIFINHSLEVSADDFINKLIKSKNVLFASVRLAKMTYSQLKFHPELTMHLQPLSADLAKSLAIRISDFELFKLTNGFNDKTEKYVRKYTLEHNLYDSITNLAIMFDPITHLADI